MTRRLVRLSLAAALAAAPVKAQTAAPQTPPAPTQPAPTDAWLPRGTAEIVMLEKMRAQPATLRIRTGEAARFGTLTVKLVSCVTRPPDLPQNAAAYVDVVDNRGGATVFKGWILSNTPAVSQMEHPAYDMRLVACR